MATPNEINSRFHTIVDVDVDGYPVAFKTLDSGQLANITGPNVVGSVPFADLATFALGVDGANISGAVANATYANTSGESYSVEAANVANLSNYIANSMAASVPSSFIQAQGTPVITRSSGNVIVHLA